MPMPDFWGSPYFVPEVDNWHLLPGAPAELQAAFEDYMKQSDVVLVGEAKESTA